jgi:hypothetical protein
MSKLPSFGANFPPLSAFGIQTPPDYQQCNQAKITQSIIQSRIMSKMPLPEKPGIPGFLSKFI